MVYMHVVDNLGVVIVKARGAEYRSPSMEIIQAARLVQHLKALGDDWLAVIRLTRLGIYQVCNS